MDSERERPAAELRLLDEVELVVGDRAVSLGGPTQRRILAALALERPNVVSIDRLADLTWGDEPPARADHNIRTYISRLRTSLRPHATIEQVGAGYRLVDDDLTIDLEEFERAATSWRVPVDVASPELLDAVDRALGSVGRRPLGDFGDEAWARPVVASLDERRTALQEARAEMLLALDRSGDAVVGLQRLAEDHPLRERPHSLLMRALVASGRTPEALRVFGEFRARLGEELGLVPSDELVALEASIARGEPVATPVARLGAYEVGPLIGAGALGRVYRGVQATLGREVAIKVVRADLAAKPAFVRAFEREARLVAALDHEAIVPLYDFWREPERAFLVMRLLIGGSLEDRLRRGEALGPDEVLVLVERIGGALDAAHRAGVVHRQVKPSNVLFDADGRPFLADFGIAFAADGDPDEAPNPALDVRALARLAMAALDPSDVAAEPLITALSPAAALSPVADGEVDCGSVTELFGRLRSSAPVEIEPATIPNPYQGLRPFDEASTRYFHGRSALVEELVTSLDAGGRRVLAVVGASGSGKSSVVRAGVLPRVATGEVTGAETWFTASMTPGRHPFEALETALLRVAVNPPGELLGQLRSGPRGIRRALARCLPRDDDTALLVIDQFEELFTLADAEETERFLDALVGAVTGAGAQLRIVVTLRADFYHRPLRHRRFAPLLKAGTVAVTPFEPEELEAAIVEPARAVGVAFGSGAVSAILGDALAEPGGLALLEYTLTEWFEVSDRRTLTLAGYEALGRIEGALVRRAEELYERFDGAQRAALRTLAGALVALGEGVEDTRRRVLRAELPDGDATNAVIEMFGRARLLIFDRDATTREPTIEVAHEVLIRAWPRLRGWLDEDRDDLRMARRVAAAAEEWQAGGSSDADLWRGGRLEAAQEWRDRVDPAVGSTSSAFIAASTGRHEAELAADAQRAADERRTNARLRRLLAGTAVLLAVSMVAGVVAFTQRRAAAQTAYDAETARLVATVGSLVDSNPREALLLAVAAFRRGESPETLGALQVALTQSSPNLGWFGYGTEYLDVEWFEEEQLVVGVRLDGLDLFDVATGELLDSVELELPVEIFGRRFNALAARGADGVLFVAGLDSAARYSLGERRLRLDTTIDLDGAGPFGVEVGPDGQVLVARVDRSLAVFDAAGELDLELEFDEPERFVDQATGVLGEFPLAWFFEPLPTMVQSVAMDDGFLVAVGSRLLRFDWAGNELGGSTFRTQRVSGDGPIPAGHPLASVRSGEDELLISLGAVQRLSIRGDWPAVSEAIEIPSTSGSGQPNVAAVLRAEPDGAIVVLDDATIRRISFEDGSDRMLLDLDIPSAHGAVEAGADGAVVAGPAGLRWVSLQGGSAIAESAPRSATSTLLSTTSDGSVVIGSPGGFTAPYQFWRPSAEGLVPFELDEAAEGIFAGVSPGRNDLRAFSSVPTSDGVGTAHLYDVEPDGELVHLGVWSDPLGGPVIDTRERDRLMANARLDLEIWRWLESEPERLLPRPANSDDASFTGVQFDPARERLLVAFSNGVSQLWDTETWETIELPHLATAEVSLGYWNRSGDLVATADPTGTVTIRDGGTFAPIQTFAGALRAFTWGAGALQFGPGDRHILSTLDGSGRLWEVQSGSRIGEPFPNVAGVVPVINADENGLRLVTGSQEAVLVWDLDTDGWAETACRVANSELSAAEWEQWGPRDGPRRDLCP